MSGSSRPSPLRWFVPGDIDGFFGLALDNIVQLLLIDGLCRFVLGFEAELLYGRVLPAVALSLVVGNIYYAVMARKLASETSRDDICALPYGINTVSLFAYVFLVMLPAKLAAEAAGASNPAEVAWRAGILACFGSSVIELGGAFVAERLRQLAPRAALLSTLSGIALGFISLGFLFRSFAHPVVGLVTLAVVVLTYFGRVKFRGRIPGGLVAVGLGTLLAWVTGLAPTKADPSWVGVALPMPVFAEFLSVVGDGGMWQQYLAIILPMGLFNVIGSLQNIESAEAAGDSYDTQPALVVNGLGSLLAAVFGSCFPTTLYIGHPGWKAMGARAGYSVLNALFMVVICVGGLLGLIAWAVPVDAGMAIVLWIGIVISAQAFSATPREHAPAVVMGILPGLAAWGALLVKNSLRVGGMGSGAGQPFSPALAEAFAVSDTWIEGAFALEQGFILTAMILAAATVCVIERQFMRAGHWCVVAAGVSATGLMHGFRYTPTDVVLELRPAWGFVCGYLGMAALFYTARWLVVAEEEGASRA